MISVLIYYNIKKFAYYIKILKCCRLKFEFFVMVKMNPNRIREPVLTVIVLQIPVQT